MSHIFLGLELLLKLLGLYRGFLDHLDSKRRAEVDEKRQKRDQAVDDQKTAQSEAQFDEDQNTIVRNHP